MFLSVHRWVLIVFVKPTIKNEIQDIITVFEELMLTGCYIGHFWSWFRMKAWGQHMLCKETTLQNILMEVAKKQSNSFTYTEVYRMGWNVTKWKIICKKDVFAESSCDFNTPSRRWSMCFSSPPVKKKGLRQLIKEFSVCPIQFETAEDTEQSGS